MIKLTLVPRKVCDTWELVEIREGDLPVAIVHIDTFNESEPLSRTGLSRDRIYYKLRHGETVTVNLVEMRE